MMTIRPSYTRGRTHREWLDSRHTFSFADYFDPDHTGFSVLRVINDDRVAPGGGFPLHSHRDMEIISYVLQGTLSHRDGMGNTMTIHAGEIQLMSAGAGVVHSEFNASESEPVHFLQIWILPAQRGLKPYYGKSRIGEAEWINHLRRVVSPRGHDDELLIHQDASLYLARLSEGGEVRHAFVPGRKGYVHVTAGAIRLKGQVLGPGDGAALQEEGELVIGTDTGAELLLFDLP